MEYLYQKCTGKTSCLINPREIITFASDRYIMYPPEVEKIVIKDKYAFIYANNVSIYFVEMDAFGTNKEIRVTRLEQCSHCNGTGAKNATEFETCSDCNGSGRVRFQQNTIFGTTIREGVCNTCRGTGKKIKEKSSTT